MRKSIKWSLGIVAAAALILFLLWVNPWGRAYYTDGISVRQTAADATLRYVVWEQPELVRGRFNQASDVYEPAVSADGRRMVFTRGRARGQADLYLVQRNPTNSNLWGEPEPLSRLNTDSDELGPALSNDGEYLYFYSNRPGGKGDYDIWMARWNGYTWVEAVNLGDEINSVFREYGPALTVHGDRLYFSSNRPRRSEYGPDDDAWRATLRELIYESDYDIFVADAEYPAASTNRDAILPAMPVFKRVERLDAINSPGDEGQVLVTPREDFIYFSSNRAGGEGGYDIYRSRFMHGKLTEPKNIGKPVNSKYNEMDPALYYDGFGIIYSSNKDQRNPNTYRLFASASRDVVLKHDYSRLARFANFIGGVKWWFLLLLAALAALVYILRLLMDPRLRSRQSLLHKCILISVLAHMLLLFLLSLWVISYRIIQKAGEAPMQISVDVRALSREKLAMEIQEDVSEIPEQSSKSLISAETWEQPEVELRPDKPSREPLVWRSEVKSAVEKKLPAEEAGVDRDIDSPGPIEDLFDDLPEMEVLRNSIAMPEMETAREEVGGEKPIQAPSRKTSQPAVETAQLELRLPPEKVDMLLAEGELPKLQLPLYHPDYIEPRRTEEIRRLEIVDNVLTNIPELEVRPAIAMQSPQPARLRREDGEPRPIRLSASRTQARAETAAADPQRAKLRELRTGIQNGAQSKEHAAVRKVGVQNRELPTPERDGISKVASFSIESRDIKPLFRMKSPEDVNIPYSMRDSEMRAAAIERLGGSSETEKAVGRALDWFARHQSKDGSWSMQKFGGEKGYEMSSTSFALLCYFGWDIKHNVPGNFKDNVSRGLDWVLSRMKDDGDLRGKDMYDQALGALALTEAYGLSKDDSLRGPAQKAVDFIVKAQNKDTGGWRYQPNDPGDTSVFGWQVMALKSAGMAGLDVPPESFRLAGKWLGKVGGGKHGGLYGYQNKSPKPGMAAESMFCRELLGTARESAMMKETADYLNTKQLDPGRIKDFYYLYYGTLALYQYKGPVWDEWNKRLKNLLLTKQVKSGNNAGSWKNVGQHGGRMGRVVSTAMATLSLEVYYRYLPLYKATENRD